ncbi:MAG: AlpA family transcriptional regulator [Betaproteobacteria bacterium]|nr:AlpA family transcriptional regulator [Betaproteobacteria bacterium]
MNSKAETFMRREQVEAATGLARSTIYELMDKGDFPKSVKIGARAVGWRGSEIQEWIYNKIKQSRGAA